MNTIEKKDLDKFKKLGISSLLSLSIIAPSAYEDKRIHTSIQEAKMQVIDATVLSVSSSFKRAVITLYAHNFGHQIEAVLFQPKPYMLRHFVKGEQHFFYGKISCNLGHCQMTHPLQISQVGGIITKYKTALRGDVMRRLISKYITHDNLLKEGLPTEIITEILSIHFPDDNQEAALSSSQLLALKYTELFDYLRLLSSKCRYFPALQKLDHEWDSWRQGLPFTLTSQQVDVITSIQNDFRKDVAAKRMIVGDVGSGKTMVILASAFMAQPHRSILMAPTTILAKQLFDEAQKHLPMLKSILIQNSTSKKVDLASYDFIIGTHALLYRDLPSAALIMIDEQHRFGTQQRNLLEKLVTGAGKRPHYLQFSATPIPRTQAMIDAAHIDVSLITQTPFKKDISTQVIHKPDFKALLEKIKEEIAQEHQVLLIYPLVQQSEGIDYQSIEEARSYWENKFSKVYVTHGKDKEKEAVLSQFKEEGNILLATTVVEVGISLPRLTTIVIVGAERLGLSTLHQLRGRVSRNGLKGYCYLYTNQKKSSRLDAFVKTDNGFDIAALDLKFRKSGDLILGSRQSGDRFKWVDMAEDETIIEAVKNDLNPLKNQK